MPADRSSLGSMRFLATLFVAAVAVMATAAPAAAAGQDQMMAQIMALTRDQVMQLDAASRDQIFALRSQMGAPL